jgi:hypothetical protein
VHRRRGAVIERVGVLALLTFIVAATLVSLYLGGKGRVRQLRRIPGLDAIKEAVGRSAEMGRGIIFSTGSGSGGLNSDSAPYHLAGLNTLGYVANLAATTQTPLTFVSAYPELMPLAEETMRDAYTVANEVYREGSVQYYGKGWGYASACMEKMEEERPAAAFWLGIFWSEALLLSETGNAVGALQIAGQPDSVNLPFQIASCDYVLIGEEMFVTGAYLSGDKALLGSVSAAEATKILVIGAIVIGAVLSTIGVTWLSQMLAAGGI